MPSGGGKYDAELGYVWAQTGADAALVIIVGGPRGPGFACKGEMQHLMSLPKLLRTVADNIEEEYTEYLREWARQAAEQSNKGGAGGGA